MRCYWCIPEVLSDAPKADGDERERADSPPPVATGSSDYESAEGDHIEGELSAGAAANGESPARRRRRRGGQRSVSWATVSQVAGAEIDDAEIAAWSSSNSNSNSGLSTPSRSRCRSPRSRSRSQSPSSASSVHSGSDGNRSDSMPSSAASSNASSAASSAANSDAEEDEDAVPVGGGNGGDDEGGEEGEEEVDGQGAGEREGGSTLEEEQSHEVEVARSTVESDVEDEAAAVGDRPRGEAGERQEEAEGEEETEGEEAAGNTLTIEPLARRAQAEPCCVLAVSATMTVLDLKRRLRRALATAGAHPPQQPTARVRTSLSVGRLRLYKRAGTRVGAVLRDGQHVGLRGLPACGGGGEASFGGGGGSGSNERAVGFVGGGGGGGGGWADTEVALQLLPADEQLSIDSIVLGCVTLDAAAAPVVTNTIAVSTSWSVATLVDALACTAGIPRRQLAFAKLTALDCGGLDDLIRRLPLPLTPQQLGTLRWGEPEDFGAHTLSAAEDFGAHTLSAPPLQLSDGDVLIVRDRHHAPPQPVPEASGGGSSVLGAASVEPRAARGGGGEARRARVATFRDDDVGFAVPASRGVHIREPTFTPSSGAAGAANGMGCT